MKQKFVNAIANDQRKGREFLSHTAQNHPNRESVIQESHEALPVIVKPKLAKNGNVPDYTDKLRAEVEKALEASHKKNKQVPKNKLITMANAQPEPEPLKEYQDILKMLLKK